MREKAQFGARNRQLGISWFTFENYGIRSEMRDGADKARAVVNN
jgi:hypothetical protein